MTTVRERVSSSLRHRTVRPEARGRSGPSAAGVPQLTVRCIGPYLAITGEEDEDTRHQVRCKLYVLEKEGSWKERGTGIFKLNVNHSSAKPRLRASSTLISATNARRGVPERD
jgi:hypothetical protein